MPWTPADAKRHTKKATSPKAQRQWSEVSNSALSRGASEKSAIMQANGVLAHHHAAGGAISPLAAMVGNPMGMRASLPKLGNPVGNAGHMRMPHVPLMDTMHNIDQHMAGAKVKLPKLKAKMGGRAKKKYADGGEVITLGARAISAVKDALSHLANNDASSAAATLRASREAMQHPVVQQAAQSLRSSSGVAPATRNLTGVVNADTNRVIMPTVGGP